MIKKVRVPARVDVRAIREKLRMTPAEFAARFHFALDVLRQWERGECVPQRSTRAYLTVIDRDPKAVRKALAALAPDARLRPYF